MVGYFSFLKQMIKNIIKCRNIIWALAVRELAVRYKGSVLGFFWTFANPMIMMVIYSVIFASLFKNSIPNYSVYVFSGILLWNAISGSINDGAGSLVANAALVTKAALPPEVIPSRVVVTHFLNYFLTLPLFFIYAFIKGMPLQIEQLQVLYLIPLNLVFIFSLVLGLSVLAAYFRDLQYLVNSLMFALFFTVPVTFTFYSLPEKIQAVLKFSPLTIMLKLNGDALFFKNIVNLNEVLYLIAWCLFNFFASILILKKLRSRIAERI